MGSNSINLSELSYPEHQSLTSATVNSLRRAIESGTFPSGSRIPSEKELIRHLGISRTTLREALRMLESEGSIERRRGVGTFVVARPIVKDFGSNFGITEMIKQAGFTPGTAAIHILEKRAPADVAAALQLPEGAPVIVLDRVRTANGAPVVWSVDAIPGALVEKEALSHFAAGSGSIYDFLSQDLKIHIVRGSATVSPLRASQEIATKLTTKSGIAILLVTQVDFDSADRPILYSVEYHLPHVFVFLINRKGPYGHRVP